MELVVCIQRLQSEERGASNTFAWFKSCVYKGLGDTVKLSNTQRGVQGAQCATFPQRN